nr:bifunctional DNA primase/polymerase [Bradyrhizobium valentinum]
MVREKEGCRFPDTPKDRLAEKVFNDSWSTERVTSLATLTKTHRDGYNLGVRLGEPSFFNDLYLHCIDLDIRDPDKADEAWGALLELIPEARSLPSVISGSMGESRHLYFLTDRPFPSKKLRHSTEKIIGKDKKAHWAWEIERFGTGKQVVVPPSIHPDTGKRYKWEREWPVDLVELGVGPVIPASRVAGWEPPSRTKPTSAPTRSASRSPRQRIFWQTCRPTPGARTATAGCRSAWRCTTFNGSKEGFKAWVEFSAASDKYDPEDQRRVWRSFRQSNKPVRMATLLSAAKEVRLMNAFDDLGDEDEIDGDDARVKPGHMDDDVDDLLGEGDDTATEQPERVLKLKQAEVHLELGHVPKRIAKLNKNHAVAFVKGKTVILTFEKDGTTSYGSVHDVYNYYENDRVATEKSTEPVTKARDAPQGSAQLSERHRLRATGRARRRLQSLARLRRRTRSIVILRALPRPLAR